MRTKILLFIIFLPALSNPSQAQVFEWRQFSNEYPRFRITVPQGKMISSTDTVEVEEQLFYRYYFLSRFPSSEFETDVSLSVTCIIYPEEIDDSAMELFWEETIFGTARDERVIRYQSDFQYEGYDGKMWRIDNDESGVREDYRAILKNKQLWILSSSMASEKSLDSKMRKKYFNSFLFD